jgi:hypothetical protein
MLAPAIADTLPLALGIALNPPAIVVGILILRRTDALPRGIAFATGWLLGLTLLLVLSTLAVQDLVGDLRQSRSELFAIVWFGLGIVLIVAAVLALRRRRLPGEQPESPRWTRIIDQGSILRMFGLGLFLATVSLRNLVLLTAAAGLMGQAQLANIELAAMVAVVVCLSSLGILVPLVMHVMGGERADAALSRGGDWLIAHMGTITAIVLAVLGVKFLLEGIGGLR